MLNLACGPSVSSAAIAVAIFVVEAGAKPVAALCSYSTWPVDRSVTSAPTWVPRLPDLISPLTLAVTPAAVATPTPDPVDGDPVAARSTLSGRARPCAETDGSWNSASRDGISRATAAPAPIVNKQSSANVSAVIRASRFTVRSPLAVAGPSTGAVTEGIHHIGGTHQSSQAIFPPGRETRPWSLT